MGTVSLYKWLAHTSHPSVSFNIHIRSRFRLEPLVALDKYRQKTMSPQLMCTLWTRNRLQGKSHKKIT